jgi:hypothetical protein
MKIHELPNRMKDNQLIRIPHFFGCMGEVRTAIWKPKILRDEQILNPKGFRYVVGPDLHLNDAVIYMLRGKTTHKTKHIRDAYTIYFFKHYRSALKYFKSVWEERVENNQRIADEYQKAQRKANSSNPQERVEGTAELLDF